MDRTFFIRLTFPSSITASQTAEHYSLVPLLCLKLWTESNRQDNQERRLFPPSGYIRSVLPSMCQPHLQTCVRGDSTGALDFSASLPHNPLHIKPKAHILMSTVMVDRVTKKKRSWMMSRVRRVNTKPELAVRSALHRMGYRFRLHSPMLPGRPDIVLRRHNAVIFVHGCFWHRHQGCRKTTTPQVRRQFWVEKFVRNMQRDKKNYRLLRQQGWRILILWECQVADATALHRRLSAFLPVEQ